jgi:hypothetical protein
LRDDKGRNFMSDECNCEKCQAGSVYARGAVAWPVGRPEAAADGRAGSAHDLYYLIIGEGGISIRLQTADL